jgi:hypothetical protein
MTDTAIARVEVLALHDNQPLIQGRGLVVEWRPDPPINDSEYDTANELPHDAPANVFDAAVFAPVDKDELDDLIADADDAHGFLVEPLADRVAEADNGHWIFDNEQPAVVEFDEDKDLEFEEEEEDADDDDDDAVNGADNDNNDAVNGADNDDNDDEGAHDNGGNDDEGAHEGVNDGGGDGGEDVPSYNLRERRPRHDNFNEEAMDNPHNGKSYYPLVQLTQDGYPHNGKSYYPLVQLTQDGHNNDVMRYIYGQYQEARTGSRGGHDARICTTRSPRCIRRNQPQIIDDKAEERRAEGN